MKLGMQVGLGPGDSVLVGTQLLLSQKGAEPPIFGPYLLWPVAGWIKMSLGREVGLSPSHVVLHGDPAPRPKKG